MLPDRAPALEGADQIMTAARRLAEALTTDAERTQFWKSLAIAIDAVRMNLEDEP